MSLPPPPPPHSTITKPPIARLSPKPPRSTLALTYDQARFPDLVRPQLGERVKSIGQGLVETSLAGGSGSGKGKSREVHQEEATSGGEESEEGRLNMIRRRRSNSITTLKSLLDSGGGEVAASSSGGGGGGRKRRPSGFNQRNSLSSFGEARKSRDGSMDELVDGEGDVVSLDELAWGTKWWPFSVVGPDSTSPQSYQGKGKGKAVEEHDSKDNFAGRGLLDVFAGKILVDEVVRRPNGTSNKPRDGRTPRLEVDQLSLSPSNLPSQPLDLPEADETPPRFLDDPPSPTTSPSTIRPLPPVLEGPSALFSTFALPNPFSSNSFFGSSGPPSPEIDAVEGENATSGLVDDDSHMAPFSIIQDSYRAPKHPCVLCHGIFGFDTIGPASIKPLQFSYWVGVKEALEACGCEVLIGRVPASASIEERARVLCEQIEAAYPGREVNLIGHSMGGLDGRFLISHLKPRTFKICSLTTIATPHAGSSFADYILEDVIGSERLPTLLGMMATLGVPGGGKAFADLTTKKMARFNDETPDDPSVAYFSYGAQFEPTWTDPFRMSWSIVLDREGPNDGLVSVESAKWGLYRATLNNVNHMDLVGWVDKIRFGLAEWRGKAIKFKPVAFYCHIVEMLANEGL